MKTLISTCTVLAIAAAAFGITQDKNSPCPLPKAGPEHAILKQFEGQWDAVTKCPAMFGQPASESTGSETNTVACNGLWLLTDHKSTMMGTPFQGHGILGYDAAKKKYVGTWVDSMTTSQMLMEGTYDEKTRTLTTISEVTGPDGKPMKWKMTHAVKDADHNTMTMYTGGPDGKDVQAMEISYTRRK